MRGSIGDERCGEGKSCQGAARRRSNIVNEEHEEFEESRKLEEEKERCSSA